MFLLVGWHYIKQGFGVMAVLAARRGVTFRPRERLAVLAHGYAAWAHAWASHAHPGLEVEEKGLVYTTLSLLPPGIDRFTRPALAATGILLAGVLLRKWRREGRLPLVAPLTALLCSIWAWSIYSGIDPLVKYMVPALHSAQYLYFVGLLSGNEAKERAGCPGSRRAAGAPRAPRGVGAGARVGPVPRGAVDPGRGAGVAAGSVVSAGAHAVFRLESSSTVVNIHHYFIDNVVWRRDNPLTRYLRSA